MTSNAAAFASAAGEERETEDCEGTHQSLVAAYTFIIVLMPSPSYRMTAAAAQPPSIVKTCPVTKLASSEP